MKNFSRTVLLKGINFFEGEIDGKVIVSAVAHVEEELDLSKNNAKGCRTVEYKVVDIAKVKALMTSSVLIPCESEIVFTMVTTKRAQTIGVESITPTKQGQIDAAALLKSQKTA
jgi:hypothetical protein